MASQNLVSGVFTDETLNNALTGVRGTVTLTLTSEICNPQRTQPDIKLQ